MDLSTALQAALLGLLEGLTEFIPVSSTGHLLLAVDLIGFRGPPGKVFEIAIQLGAILAVCWLYRDRLFGSLGRLGHDPAAQRFYGNLFFGVLPALLIGFFAHRFIKEVLFSPWVVSVALILGGFVILAVERMKPVARVADVDDIRFGLALRIGLCQAVAMIPGVSRSGATILGGMLLGLDRRTATEFSFHLAVPTMAAATAYDLFRNRDSLDMSGGAVIAIGFVAAFLAALLVVRAVVGFVARHGFVPFAWYRIAIGTAMLALLVLR
ncbi:undecaprenyl-diphosphatase [Stella humosa]|uniref:Undecaprenyl-diphosphatase n=1 Tax=Stella humosa TaxID=94 RepID=A0A3N1M9F7_9PROT|nr:undecaprenyl-diphosphate phosphatase [Stella humosa]ROP99674.1 undecaprenyl-diphosphatase [Stella humosa]BBK31101.1 undecaprenyl-diphosphatase [Stella humosa]